MRNKLALVWITLSLGCAGGVPLPVAPIDDEPVAFDAGVVVAPAPEDAGAPTDAGLPGSPDAGDVDAGTPPRGPFRILFDAAHQNSVGNADWVLDSHAPLLLPAHPTSETQWSGGISAWGFDLHTSGRYDVGQVPSGTALSFGGGGPGDLSGFDVFVSDEPEAAFSDAEQTALMQFVGAGGGIFFVADHSGAKRCSSCVEAWRVINAFLVTAGGDAFGVRFDGTDIGQSGLTGSASTAQVTSHFTGGPFGGAAGLSFHSGTSGSLTGRNAAATVVVESPRGGLLLSSSLASGGRLVLLGDSSPTDDGTCTGCGATLYDGWGEVDNAHFILNATAWLAHDGS